MLRLAAAVLAIGATAQAAAPPPHAVTPAAAPAHHGGPHHAHVRPYPTIGPYVIVPPSYIDAALASPKPKPSKKPKPKPSPGYDVFGVYKN